MNDCCGVEFAAGVTLQGSTFVDGEIQNSVIMGSRIEDARIANLTSIDEESVRLIAIAMSDMPPDQLAILAKAIMEVLPKLEVAEEPASTTAQSLPTEVTGDRQSLLGKPKNWLQYNDYVIPAY